MTMSRRDPPTIDLLPDLRRCESGLAVLWEPAGSIDLDDDRRSPHANDGVQALPQS
jgi:hypothetical protein